MTPQQYDEYQYIEPMCIGNFPGWTIIDTMYSEEYKEIQECIHKDQYGIGTYNTKITPLKKVHLLIGRKNEDVLASKLNIINILQSELYTERSKIEYLTEDLEGIKRAIESDKIKHKNVTDELQRELDVKEKRNNELSSKCHKMESDLNKVQQEIGNLKFKEIVGIE